MVTSTISSGLATLAIASAFMAFTVSAQSADYYQISLWDRADCSSSTNTGANKIYPYVPFKYGCNGPCQNMKELGINLASVLISDPDFNTICSVWKDEGCPGKPYQSFQAQNKNNCMPVNSEPPMLSMSCNYTGSVNGKPCVPPN